VSGGGVIFAQYLKFLLDGLFSFGRAQSRCVVLSDFGGRKSDRNRSKKARKEGKKNKGKVVTAEHGNFIRPIPSSILSFGSA